MKIKKQILFLFAFSSLLFILQFISAACINPSSDMAVNGSITFCDQYQSFTNMNIVANNLVIDCNNSIISPGYTGLLFKISNRNNITIKNCQVLREVNIIVEIQESKNIILRNNNFTSSWDSTVRVRDSSFITLINNSIYRADYGAAIYFSNVSDSTIQQNQLHNNGYSGTWFYAGGIYMAASQRNNITNNNIFNNKRAIMIQVSSNNIFTNNTMCKNDYMSDCTNANTNTASGNKIGSDDAKYCTFLATQSSHCTDQSCSDTDGGLKFFIKGSVTDWNGTGFVTTQDSCYDANSTIEYYCENDFAHRSDSYYPAYPCSYGCNDGACWNGCWEDYDCNDQNSSTNDICVNPQTAQSFCTHTALPIACFNNAQCGTNAFVGSNFCSSGNVFRNFRTFTCVNPGTISSYCSNSTSSLLNQTCSNGCTSGVCNAVNLTVNDTELYTLLNSTFKTHMNYFLSSDAVTSYGLPLTAYKPGLRARFGYSVPAEWGYLLENYIAASEQKIITNNVAVQKINTSLNTMLALQNDVNQNYRNLFYNYYQVTQTFSPGADVFPYHNSDLSIPSIDNGLLYMSLLITEGWAKDIGNSEIELKARTIKNKMNFSIFLFTSGNNQYMAHTINAGTNQLSSSKWDVYSDEGGLMSLIAYLSGGVNLNTFKNLTNSQLRNSASWNGYTTQEAAWFNSMFAWSVRSLAGIDVAKTPFSTQSFVPATKSHLSYGTYLGVNYPGFSDAMTQGLVGYYVPANLAGAVPNPGKTSITPHAFFVPFNVLGDLDSSTIAKLVNNIKRLQTDTGAYYYSTGTYPYGFVVGASAYENQTNYAGIIPSDGKIIFETLSQSYITLSLFNALQKDGRNFNYFANKVNNYSTNLGKAMKFLYPSYCSDADNDNYSVTGGVCGPIDCNDNNALINPGRAEIYNSVDDNCNGQVDEGFTVTCSSNAQCGTNTWTGVNSCNGNNVWNNFKTYTCNNAGTVSSYCSSSTVFSLRQTCANSCSNGVCVNASVIRKTDLALWNPLDGKWWIVDANGNGISTGNSFGAKGMITVPGDYDGDGKNDQAVWNPTDGKWYVNSIAKNQVIIYGKQFGSNGMIPVSGDYDGDARSDLGLFNPANGKWYVYSVAKTSIVVWDVAFGSKTMTPVSGDYDGDGKSDLALWNPADGKWYIRDAANTKNIVYGLQFGSNGMKAVSGDYDGDGKSDLALWNPTDGKWYIRQATNLIHLVYGKQFGSNGMIPVSGDYDGDKKSDLALWNPTDGKWYVSSVAGASIVWAKQWGTKGMIPVSGDYNGA